jgi:hypothetical protein
MAETYNRIKNIFEGYLIEDNNIVIINEENLIFEEVILEDGQENDFHISFNTEIYAEYLTQIITYSIDNYGNNKSEKIIFMCFDIFENYIKNKFSNNFENILKKIYESKIYDWYFGNILTFLFTVGYRYDLYGIHRQYLHINHQLYIKSYDIITKYNISVYDTDYYGSNMYDCISYIERQYPARIDIYFNSFKFLARYGVRINNIQKKYLSKFYKKRKESVKLIENYFFEILHSPYTKIGKKNLEKKAIEFNKRLKLLK